VVVETLSLAVLMASWRLLAAVKALDRGAALQVAELPLLGPTQKQTRWVAWSCKGYVIDPPGLKERGHHWWSTMSYGQKSDVSVKYEQGVIYLNHPLHVQPKISIASIILKTQLLYNPKRLLY
jgi:hypothetical protein